MEKAIMAKKNNKKKADVAETLTTLVEEVIADAVAQNKVPPAETAPVVTMAPAIVQNDNEPSPSYTVTTAEVLGAVLTATENQLNQTFGGQFNDEDTTKRVAQLAGFIVIKRGRPSPGSFEGVSVTPKGLTAAGYSQEEIAAMQTQLETVAKQHTREQEIENLRRKLAKLESAAA